jgi:nicotinamide-nucleotide amidase
VRAQILSIGSELMLGHLTDTNATYLAQQLAGLGIELTLVTQVGDDLNRLSAAIERATNDAEIVICTGGVGPTADDLTREAIAQVMGETPEINETLLETVRSFFLARGVDMPERNKKQAWLIPSAEALPNPVGTAPGWFVRRDGHVIAAMPGVPREMFRMWSEQVVPRLIALEGAASVRSITLRTIGIGESAAEQVLHDLVAIDNPVVATYAKDDGVHVRVTAVAACATEAERVRDETAAEVTRRLDEHIYAVDEVTLPQALAQLLHETGHIAAISDSGGGGRFASLLAGHPESAALLAGATLTNQPKPAVALARSAASTANNAVGVGIRVEAALTGSAVYEGEIRVALDGPLQVEEIMPMRSGYEDMQRRSALFAADVLRRGLKSLR